VAYISDKWDEILGEEFKKPYYKDLYLKIKEEYSNHVVFPPSDEIFTAYKLTDFDDVKVVILGQDPYPNENQAHGLSFSVKPGIATPKSLVNIYKELHDEMGLYIPNNGYLVKWASQGVLMLNTVLTVRAHQADSHKGYGWEHFTDATINALVNTDRPIVYMLWGSNSKAKMPMLTNKNQLVLYGPHPSPLSAYRGFFGCNHFVKCNEFLKNNGIKEIDWQIENI